MSSAAGQQKAKASHTGKSVKTQRDKLRHAQVVAMSPDEREAFLSRERASRQLLADRIRDSQDSTRRLCVDLGFAEELADSAKAINRLRNQLLSCYGLWKTNYAPCGLSIGPVPDEESSHLGRQLAVVSAFKWQGVEWSKASPAHSVEAAKMIFVHPRAEAVLHSWEAGQTVVLIGGHSGTLNVSRTTTSPSHTDDHLTRMEPTEPSYQCVRLPLQHLLWHDCDAKDSACTAESCRYGSGRRMNQLEHLGLEAAFHALVLFCDRRFAEDWSRILAMAVPRSSLRTMVKLHQWPPVNTHPLFRASEGMVACPSAPLVSALCVTRLADMKLIRRCLTCFRRQTYSPRELVLLYDVHNPNAVLLQQMVKDILGELECAASDRYTVMLIPVDEAGRTLGELRNESIQNASGEYIIQWDDDDWHHPERISTQLRAILRQTDSESHPVAQRPGAASVSPDGRVVASFMTRWIHKVEDRFVLCQSNRWPGSLMCETAAMPPYTAKAKSEDSVLCEELIELGHGIELICDAGLYVYEFHGKNTWSKKHVEDLMETYGVAEYTESFLRQALSYETCE